MKYSQANVEKEAYLILSTLAEILNVLELNLALIRIHFP